MLIDVDAPEVMWAEDLARKALERADVELREAADRLNDAKDRVDICQVAVDTAREKVKGACLLVDTIADRLSPTTGAPD